MQHWGLKLTVGGEDDRFRLLPADTGIRVNGVGQGYGLGIFNVCGAAIIHSLIDFIDGRSRTMTGTVAASGTLVSIDISGSLANLDLEVADEAVDLLHLGVGQHLDAGVARDLDHQRRENALRAVQRGEVLVQNGHVAADSGLALDEHHVGAGVRQVMDANRDLVTFLESPQVREQEKKELLQSVFGDMVEPVLLKFFYLLLDKNRIENIRDIGEVFADLDARSELQGLLGALLGWLVPTLAVVITYTISAATGQVPTCFPFFEGCTSISSAARSSDADSSSSPS